MEHELAMKIRSAEAIMVATIDAIESTNRKMEARHLYPIVHQVHELLKDFAGDKDFGSAASVLDHLHYDLVAIPESDMDGHTASDVQDRMQDAVEKLAGKLPEAD